MLEKIYKTVNKNRTNHVQGSMKTHCAGSVEYLYEKNDIDPI